MKANRLLILISTLILTGTLLSGAEVTNPLLKQGAMPAYPEAARIHNAQGTVIIEALVDEKGQVFAADVVGSVDRVLDLAAVEAIKDWTFEPAMEDGKPVMKVVRIPVKFNLVDPIAESLKNDTERAFAKK